MEKEYDLINELGYRNWIDGVAGEAVVLGSLLKNLELEAWGAELANLVGTIKYDSDRFYQVEAKAKLLETEVRRIKLREARTVYIEEICLGREGAEDEWEFDFILVEGRYEIRLMLPTYRGRDKLFDKIKLEIERRVLAISRDEAQKEWKMNESTKIFNGQDYLTTCYFDGDVLVRRVIDHRHDPADHEGRGHLDVFYFDDYTQAREAWKEVREVTSGRKR